MSNEMIGLMFGLAIGLMCGIYFTLLALSMGGAL